MKAIIVLGLALVAGSIAGSCCTLPGAELGACRDRCVANNATMRPHLEDGVCWCTDEDDDLWVRLRVLEEP